MTTAGSITLRRRYLSCRHCRLGGCAADDVLGIDGSLSRPMVDLAALYGTVCTSFDKAAVLLRVHRRPVSDEKIRQVCHRAGQQVLDSDAAQTVAATFARAEGEPEFYHDAFKINTRESGWRDMKLALYLRRSAAPSATWETWEERRLPPANARWMHAAIEPIEDFETTWQPTASALGIKDSRHLLASADGADYIWKAIARAFPGCQENLDPWHGYSYLADAARIIHGEGTAAFAEAYAAGKDQMLRHGWEGVCRWVAQQRPLAAEADCPASLDPVTTYFSKHLTRMNYTALLHAGRPIGSGPVEGACKTLQDRLKGRSHRWNALNANRMAALVCLESCHAWKDWWATTV